MSARNQHVRQSTPYIQKRVDGSLYHFYPYSWEVTKDKIRYTSNKVAAGKLQIPADCQVAYGITIIYVTADNQLSATEA